MSNPHNRPKHKQHREWFKITLNGERKIVRPVNGKDWFDEPGYECGIVHLIDENSDVVGICEIPFFEKNAIRIQYNDD